MSETGSLDRMKAAAERRKKGLDDSVTAVSGRVEETRVNPNSLIDELLKNTKLDQLEESAESESLIPYIRFNNKIKIISIFDLLFQQLDYNCLSQVTELLPWEIMKLNLEQCSNKLLWIIADSSAESMASTEMILK